MSAAIAACQAINSGTLALGAMALQTLATSTMLVACDGTNECLSDCDGQPWGQRRDPCNVCGGDGTTCINFLGNDSAPIPRVVRDKTTGLTATDKGLIGLAIAVPVSLLICAAIVAAFFLYKRMTNPYWMVPAGLLDNMNTGVVESPLYQGGGGWQSNALGD
jgi:hypothetical protein